MSIPINIITEYIVNIRPCEFQNFAKLLNITTKSQFNSKDYFYLMDF